jgi:hypothetical protein
VEGILLVTTKEHNPEGYEIMDPLRERYDLVDTVLALKQLTGVNNIGQPDNLLRNIPVNPVGSILWVNTVIVSIQPRYPKGCTYVISVDSSNTLGP